MVDHKISVVFFGTGEYTIPVIKVLVNRGLALIVTTDNNGEVAGYARKHNIPLLVSDLRREEDVMRIRDISPNLGVLASYGAIISQKVIDMFSLGILNIHPSLLPKYKGPSPIQNTILNGDDTCGVSIILLDSEIDHGPVVCARAVRLQGGETTLELKDSLFFLGSEMISQVLDRLAVDPKIKSVAQDHGKESFTEKILSRDAYIDLENPPDLKKLDRMTRAYYPSPGVFFETNLSGRLRRVKLLPFGKIQIEGKRIMSYRDFINGYGSEAEVILSKLGLSVES